jgi:predicted N-acetyltransferase YhbS
MMLRIDEEKLSDHAPREALLDEAFGPDRFAKTCERLREGRSPADGLALVARAGDAFAGTIRFWHVAAGGVPALLLGPVAVAEEHRGLGVGGKLIRRGLSIAGARGHRAVLLVGDAPYYARFGFERRHAQALDLPGWYDPARFLGIELRPGALGNASGMVVATGLPAPDFTCRASGEFREPAGETEDNRA